MADPTASTTADRTADEPPTTSESPSTTADSQSTTDDSQSTTSGSQSTTDDSRSTTGRLSTSEQRIDPATLLRIGGVGCLLVVGWLSTGVVGLAVGAGVAAVAYSRPVVAVALGQAGLLVVVPDLVGGRSPLILAAFEGGLVAILLSERPVDRPTVVLTVAVGVVFVAVVVSALSWAGLAAASVAIVVVAGVIGYSIHRFERVALGLAASTDTEPGATYE